MQTRHLLCFIYSYPHLPVGVSCAICQSVGSTSGLTLYLSFLFSSAILLFFHLLFSVLLEPISFYPFYQVLRLGGVMPFGLMLLCKLCVEQQISFCLSISFLSLFTRVSSSFYKKCTSYPTSAFHSKLCFFFFIPHQSASLAEGCDTFDRSTPQLFKLDALLHIHNSSTFPSFTRLFFRHLLRCPSICPPYITYLSRLSFLVHPSTVSSVLFIIVILPVRLFARCCLLALLSFVSFSLIRFRLKTSQPNALMQSMRSTYTARHHLLIHRRPCAPSLPQPSFSTVCLSRGSIFFGSSTWDRAWTA